MNRVVAPWLDRVARSLSTDSLDKITGAQQRCSGIELVLARIDDLTSVQDDESRDSYLERVRTASVSDSSFPLLSRLDWDSLSNECRDGKLSVEASADRVRAEILKHVLEHGEFLDVFVPHLVRPPRDVDGKLIPNKDAGCAPPMGSHVQRPQIEQSVSDLEDKGFLTIRNAVDLDSIEKVRAELSIRSSFSGNNTTRFATRGTNPEAIFLGDRAQEVSYTQLASGRYSYQLRCSSLEKKVKPLHASIMPIVWEYLAVQRKDALLNGLLGDSVKSQKLPRVFLSSVSLVCSDPLSGRDSWHATNGGGGVVVMVPLSPHEDRNGNTLVLPGTHKTWSGLSGIVWGLETVLRSDGVNELNPDCGDAVIMDSRILRTTMKNELFNRSKVWVVFHYDFSDKCGPYQWLPRTLFMNALAAGFVHLDNLYRRLPPISHPNKLE